MERKVRCAVDLQENWNYDVDPQQFLGYIGEITIWIGDYHISLGYLTVDEIKQLSKELIEGLDFELGIFDRLAELRKQSE